MTCIDASECQSYDAGPPWVFKGRAAYQLNLVKAEVARALIPPELQLVEAFGYTLGGIYYAHYDDSPAGSFDELVVLPGIVWNPPTSCGWASAVLVDSAEAKNHGVKAIGLPSRHVSFRPSILSLPLISASQSKQPQHHSHARAAVSTMARLSSAVEQQHHPYCADSDSTSATSAGATTAVESREESGLKKRFLLPLARVTTQWEKWGRRDGYSQGKERGEERERSREVDTPIVRVSEAGRDGRKDDLFAMTPPPLDRSNFSLLPPQLSLVLPNFSGRTISQPSLLHYCCNLKCRLGVARTFMQLITHDSLHSHHSILPSLPSSSDKSTANVVTSTLATSPCCGCTAVTCSTCTEDSWKELSARKPSERGRKGSSAAHLSSSGHSIAALADLAAVQKLPCDRHSVWVMRQVLASRPVVSIVFDDMDMRVGAPQEVGVGADGRLDWKQ